MDIVTSILVIIGAYLLGSLPVGLLLVRITTGKDIRKVGSGRIGGTNVMRAAGPWVALVAIVGDFGKGLLAVYMARFFGQVPAVEALAGLLAVIGHNYSIFIGFKGGAGTMTTLGSAVGLWPWSLLFLAVVGIIMVVITRYASVGSISISLLLPIIFILRAWSGDAPWAYLIHGLGTSAMTMWSLRPNIRRLQEGKERQVTLHRNA